MAMKRIKYNEGKFGKARLRRVVRTRQKIREMGAEDPELARLTVARSNSHVYAQVFTADGSTVLASASSLDKDLRDKEYEAGKLSVAKAVGLKIAELATKAGVKKVAFDRSGYKFHGRIKALADAARENGLEF